MPAFSMSVNVVKEPWNRRPEAVAHGDLLARAVNLDMVAVGWRPTVDNLRLLCGELRRQPISQRQVRASTQKRSMVGDDNFTGGATWRASVRAKVWHPNGPSLIWP
jgi:hypothetical protein